MTRKRNSTPRVASSRAVDDFKIIYGIGPLYEKHLHNAGVRTFAQLAKLTPEDVATHLPNLSASQIRKQGWSLQARKLAAKKAKAKPRRKKPTVPTTSQHYENFTLEFLLNEKNKLRRLRIMHVQSGDVETWANWNSEEVSYFLARHTGAGIPEGIIQKPKTIAAKPRPPIKGAKTERPATPKIKHHSAARKSVNSENKTQPKKKTSRKPEAVSVPKVKKDQAKSAQPKAKRSRISKLKSAKPVVITPANTKEKKVQEEVTQTRTKQSRSKVRTSVKPIVKTPPAEISQKADTPTVPKVEQDQARSAPVETRQSKNLAPILFGPATEIFSKRLLQKSKTSSSQEEVKQQVDRSQTEASQPQAIRETNSQTGVIRLLQWNNSMPDSDQSVKSLSHNQTFDAKLTLDISSLPITKKSQLNITGTLLAKKLGTHEHRVIGKTQAVIPYSPTINLCVGKLTLEQGLYRLEAEIKLIDPEAVSLSKGIDTIIQGGLFQVY